MKKFGLVMMLLIVAELISCASESAQEQVNIPKSARDKCPTDTTLESLEKKALLVSGSNDFTVINDYYDKDGYLLEHIESTCDISSSYFGGCGGDGPDLSSWQTGYIFLHMTTKYAGEMEQESWACYYYRKI